MSDWKDEKFADFKKNEKVSKKVVTKTVEERGGVQTTTTTITCGKDDFEAAFKKLNLDPIKFQSGGNIVTKQIIYTNSDGKKEVLEETAETYDEPNYRSLLNKEEPTALKAPVKTPRATKVNREAPPGGSESKPSKVKPGKFEDDCLKSHNDYRIMHGVPKLSLSAEICSYAKEWADHLAATDGFKHRTDRKYGENIYMKWSSDPNHSVTGAEAVESWYSEIKDHTFGAEPRSLKSGHFTQVIWKESKSMGVAWARSKSGKILVVANYDPPGNFVGKFATNVPPPKK